MVMACYKFPSEEQCKIHTILIVLLLNICSGNYNYNYRLTKYGVSKQATKLARGAGLDSALAPAAARSCIGARAPIQCYTGRTPDNIHFFGCLICGTPVVTGLRIVLKGV